MHIMSQLKSRGVILEYLDGAGQRWEDFLTGSELLITRGVQAAAGGLNWQGRGGAQESGFVTTDL